MVILNHAAPPVAGQVLTVEIIQGLMAMVAGARVIEAWFKFEQRLESLWGYFFPNAICCLLISRSSKSVSVKFIPCG